MAGKDEIMTVLSVVLAAVLAYLIGSVNFAIITSKLFAQKDIRDYGSGNAGMTNVLRILGKGPAVLVTAGDFLKGVAAIALGRWLGQLIGGEVPFYMDHIVALAATLGHCFPIFYKFKGGKGILVSAGIILMTHPLVLVAQLLIFLVLVLATRIVSVGSLSVAVAYPILVLIIDLVSGTPHAAADVLSALVRAAIVIWMHRGNVKRLANGTENRFGQKKA